MAKTRNGWPVDPSAARTALTAPGCSDTGEVLTGPVHRVAQAFVLAFDAEVEPVTSINGFRSPAFNASINGDPRSNHMSATAWDLNGARHPYEANTTKWKSGFTADQVVAVRAILARFEGAIRWGLDFNVGFRDGMHFEIHGTAEQVAAIADRITEGDEMSAETEAKIDAIYKALGAGGLEAKAAGLADADTVLGCVRTLATALAEVKADTGDVRLALSGALPRLLAAADGEVDEAALAHAIAQAVPDALAAQVVDELLDRLKS